MPIKVTKKMTRPRGLVFSGFENHIKKTHHNKQPKAKNTKPKKETKKKTRPRGLVFSGFENHIKKSIPNPPACFDQRSLTNASSLYLPKSTMVPNTCR